MLSNTPSQLVQVFGLSDVSNDQELSQSILALLTTAHEDTPRIPLSRIAHEITKADAASLLDPLDTLPILLPCKDPAAKDILLLMAECGSAKETVMSIQEAIERMISAISNEDEQDATHLPFPKQLAVLIDLYSAAIPRLKLRHKTASETIQPLLSELEEVVQLSGPLARHEEGRSLIDSVSRLIIRLQAWIHTIHGEQTDERKACYRKLGSILDCTLIAHANHIHAALAQRSLELFYPRLAFRSSVPPGWEAGEEVISAARNAYSSLNISPESMISAPSLQGMIILAHSGLNTSISIHLPKLILILIASLRSNCGLDESLAVLLYALDPSRPLPRPYLSEDIIHPLFAVISPLSSSHPDSLVRHQSFRILSLLLASCPPPVRLHFLRELAVDENFPQMRVAAVGLVKEAVLEGLSHPPSLFASPSFLDVFGSILFRPSPPDLFANQSLSIDKFQESSEPARLVECLGTYYIILQRDKNNMTKLRNPDVLRTVEASLLGPLRESLDRFTKEQSTEDGHAHHVNSIGSLQIAISRVDYAISQVIS